MKPTPWKNVISITTTILLTSWTTTFLQDRDPIPEERDEAALRFVVPERAPLQAIPAHRGAPEVGELFAGTAVLLHEERDGFARVTLQAWVREESLSRQRTDVGPAAREDPGNPVLKGLRYARHVDVVARAIEDGSIPLSVSLITRDGRVVHFDEKDLRLEWTLFEERRIAGGRVRGPRLGSGQVDLVTPGTEFSIPLAGLDVERVMLSVKVVIDDRTLYGAETGIELNR